MYFVSIDAGAQVAIILLVCGPCVVIVNCSDRFYTLGRAPRTKETLPDIREWCRVTRHPRVFRRLTGCQRDTPVMGRHSKNSSVLKNGCVSIEKEKQSNLKEGKILQVAI